MKRNTFKILTQNSQFVNFQNMKRGTQIKLARLARVSPSHMNQIILRRRYPGRDLAKRLAMITKTDTDLWLYGSSQEIIDALSCDTQDFNT